jgi:hypothetical protein
VDQGEPTFILAFGPFGRLWVQRITRHKLDHQSCVRACNPGLELKQWQALSTVDETDFNWRCCLCFSGLRVNAEARKTEGHGLITEEDVTKRAVAEDDSASESDTESSSTDGKVDTAMASPSKAKGEADKAKRLYLRQSSFSPRHFSTLGPPWRGGARALSPSVLRPLLRGVGWWGSVAGVGFLGGGRGAGGPRPLTPPISGFPHHEACGGRWLPYSMQDVFWSRWMPPCL